MSANAPHGLAGTRARLMLTTALVCFAATPALAVDYSVGTEAELRAALTNQADGDTITFTNDIVLTSAGGGDLPAIQSNITIDGNGNSLNGGGAYRGLFVYSGDVRLEDLSIENAVAEGGEGGSRGGGGAGLGGALFVNSGATVTVSNVSLVGNQAVGGDGGKGVVPPDEYYYAGGGGGLGGDGGDAIQSGGAGGGGIGSGAVGGNSDDEDEGHGADGIVAGAAAGGDGRQIGLGGGDGGGGGATYHALDGGGGGGGIGGGDGDIDAGGNGGFGGGGGGGGNIGSGATGGDGGFGGGGGGGLGLGAGGDGGFGGGGGGSGQDAGAGSNGLGGFGGGQGGYGNGSRIPNVGGGGGGMGGAIFVAGGGGLIIEGNFNVGGSAVAGGATGFFTGVSAATAGEAFGSGLFLEGAGNLILAPAAGDVQTISDVIADMKGVVDNGYVPPAGTYTGTEIWSLTKNGAGELVLTEENLYSGGTSITGGKLTAENRNALGSGDVAISNGATLKFDATSLVTDMRYNVAVSGSATLGAAGGRNVSFTTVTLGDGAAAQLHIGGTDMTGTVIAHDAVVTAGSSVFVDGGTVLQSTELFSGATGGTTVAEGAIVDMLQLSMTLHQLSGAGTVRTHAVTSPTPTLTLNNSTDSVFSGDIHDNFSTSLRIRKTGVGALTLSGEVTIADTLTVDAGLLTLSGVGDTGLVTVNAGELRVNGTLATPLATIAAAGRLGGTGTIGSTTVNGTIAAGNSIGTLTVDGNFIQGDNSSNEVELGLPGVSDLIHVTGTATIGAGTSIEVTNVGGVVYVPGTRYTILTADGGVSGEYDLLLGDIGGVSAFFSLEDAYDVNNVYLDVIKVRSFADAALTPNQIATAEGLDSLAGGPLVGVVGSLADDAAARAAFDALSGEVHASARTALIEESRIVRDTMVDRLHASSDAVAASFSPILAYGPGGPDLAPPAPELTAAWGSAFGTWGEVLGDGNAAALSYGSGGFLAGIDTAVADGRLGVLVGYSHLGLNVDERNSAGAADNYHFGAYGGVEAGAAALRGGLGYSINALSTTRGVTLPGLAEQLTADYLAGTFQAFGEVGYRLETDGALFEPFLNLAYVNQHNAGYVEHGGDAALTGKASGADAAFATLGLRASTGMTLDNGMELKAAGMLGWQHGFGDAPEVIHSFAGSDLFTIAGVPFATDTALVEAELSLGLSATTSLSLSYDGQFAADLTRHAISAGLGGSF